MEKLILEGFMGSGKSTYGRELAKNLLIKFTDTDCEIEKKNQKTIANIFELYGEEAFRNMETDYLLEKSASLDKVEEIISIGGGMPVRSENRELMKKIGTVVYLKAEADFLKKRLRGKDNSRPMLAGDNKDEKIDRLLEEREDAYLDAADYVLHIDKKDLDSVINELKGILHGRRKGMREL
ncbi:MAG: shikimate kinase [Lachnospiraceae bacterium]|nr:shikimate kinase [Lachnospiraceae bacterium]